MSVLPYEGNGVRIDRSLARGNGETIQISTITAISGSTSYPIMFWLPGLAAGMGGLGALLGGQALLGLALVIVAVVCFRQSGRSKTYNVNVTTSAGGTKTFAETRDAAAAQEIRSALEAAISERG